MTWSVFLPFLALFTLGVVLVFALLSRKRIRDRMKDPNAPKSTLAKDGPQGGVEMLNKDN